MATLSRQEQRRAQHQRYKEDVDREGKPFYPFAMVADTVMSLVVVSVIVALSVIWYFTSGEDPEDVGWLGARYEAKADPGTTNFVPRPDWYFYFLFYLLRIFKWPDSVILATVGIPTILMVLMFALPFLDVRRERRLLRRPVAAVAALLVAISMGVLTWKGATVQEARSRDSEALVAEWVEVNRLPEEARPGAMLFVESGCQQCHTYLGAGSSNFGAPDLTDVGARTGRGVEGFVAFLKNPPPAMRQFTKLGDDNLRQISIFLDASKGAGG